jgi:hypothetical protein
VIIHALRLTLLQVAFPGSSHWQVERRRSINYPELFFLG